MRPFIAFGSIALVLCLAALTAVEGQTTGGTKTDPKKGPPAKTTTPPPKKTNVHLNPSLSKGAVTFGAKDLKDLKAAGKTVKGKQPPLHTFYSQQLKTSIDSGKVKLDPGQQAAWNKLAAQQPLTFDDRQQLSNLLFKGSDAGLTSADETALSYLLTDDLARHAGAGAAPDGSGTPPTGPLFLRAVNKTTEPIKVFVQIVAKEPGEPGSKKAAQLETMKYELKAGLAYDLQDKTKQRVKASVIRIWALSPSRQWASNRDQDLPLTSSTASKVFVVTFAPPTAPAGGDITIKSGGGKLK